MESEFEFPIRWPSVTGSGTISVPNVRIELTVDVERARGMVAAARVRKRQMSGSPNAVVAPMWTG